MLLRIVARTMKKQELCGTKWIAEMEEGKALRQPLRRGRGGCDNNCKARRTIEHYICSVRTKTKWYSYDKTDFLTKSMNWEDNRSLLLYQCRDVCPLSSLSLQVCDGASARASRREKDFLFSQGGSTYSTSDLRLKK